MLKKDEDKAQFETFLKRLEPLLGTSQKLTVTKRSFCFDGFMAFPVKRFLLYQSSQTAYRSS